MTRFTGGTIDSLTAGPLPRRAALAVVFTCLALGGISSLELNHVSIAHGQHMAWGTVLPATMPRWILLAAMLPIVLRVGVSPSRPRLKPGTIVLHLALFLVISWMHAAVTAWAMGIQSPVAFFFPWSARFLRAWYSTMPTIVSLYGAVLITAWGLAEAREREHRSIRASQLEAQLQAARLEALRAKLQPHFLYNTLNSIAALVASVQPARAVAAIEQLGELLHASLGDDGREEIPVTEEIALAERYLELQRMRFGARLQYDVDIAPEVADCLVPVLLLQPIVENAVVHGLDAGIERLRVTISARESVHGVELRVDNDGTSLEPEALAADDSAARSGVGLAGTRARLATAYGDRASLQLTPRPGGGARVRVTLPRSPAAASEPNRRSTQSFVEVS